MGKHHVFQQLRFASKLPLANLAAKLGWQSATVKGYVLPEGGELAVSRAVTVRAVVQPVGRRGLVVGKKGRDVCRRDEHRQEA